MKLKLLASVIVAVVMGSAVPARAAPYQVMYGYFHFENGELVGSQRDVCTRTGVIIQGQWLWGYGTNDVMPYEWAGCEEGQVVFLQ